MKKGISLIVLVITIIVMTILATAVIVTLENTNLTNKSKTAVNKNNYAQEITRLEVIKNGILTDNLGKITIAEYIAELTNKGIIVGTVTDNANGSKTFTTDTGAEVTVTQNGSRDLLIEIAGYEQGNNSGNEGGDDTEEVAGENQLNGTWIFNEEISYHNYLGYNEVNFTSNGVSYIGMNLWDETTTTPTGNTVYNYGIGYNTTEPVITNYWAVMAFSYGINGAGVWSSDAYRTVNFGSAIQNVDAKFYTWFVSNATKQ